MVWCFWRREIMSWNSFGLPLAIFVLFSGKNVMKGNELVQIDGWCLSGFARHVWKAWFVIEVWPPFAWPYISAVMESGTWPSFWVKWCFQRFNMTYCLLPQCLFFREIGKLGLLWMIHMGVWRFSMLEYLKPPNGSKEDGLPSCTAWKGGFLPIWSNL